MSPCSPALIANWCESPSSNPAIHGRQISLSDKTIELVRWVLLASVFINVLQATLLFDFFERRLFEPFFAYTERMGGAVPGIMRNKLMHRISPLVVAIVSLILWWYLGTPEGVALLRGSAQNHPRPAISGSTTSPGYVCATIVVILYGVYSVLGLYLALRLSRLGITAALLKRGQIDPTLYSADARVWLERDRIWRKAAWPVWIGSGVAAWLLCSLF